LIVKRKALGPIVRTPDGVKPVRYIWIFTQKQNKNDEIVRYKTQLIA